MAVWLSGPFGNSKWKKFAIVANHYDIGPHDLIGVGSNISAAPVNQMSEI